MEPDQKNYSILRFEFIPNNKLKLEDCFREIHFEICDSKFNFKSFKNNEIKLYNEIIRFEKAYNEIISFYSIDNFDYPSITCVYTIYFNEINNIYIYYDPQNREMNKDDNENKKNIKISAELLFQGSQENFLPKKIHYDNLTLDKFDYFKNGLRKRMEIINFNPNSIDLLKNINDNNKFNLEEDHSYKIILKYFNKNNPELSITNYELIKNGKELSIKFKEEKKNIFDILYKFFQEFQLFFDEAIENGKINETHLEQINDEYKIICDLINNWYQNGLHYDEFEELDKGLFYFMFYYNEFLSILDLFYKHRDEFARKIEILKKINKKYEKDIKKVINYQREIKDSLLIMKEYNTYFLNSYKTNLNLEYISVISVNELEKNNLYMKVIDFIKDIINNLKEDSKLYEIILSLYNELIQNSLVINEEKKVVIFKDIYGNEITKKYEKSPSEYEIKLPELDEIKKYLIELTPRYIIRIRSDMNFSSKYNNCGKIITINEKILLKENLEELDISFKNNTINYSYILPIVMEILNDILYNEIIRKKKKKENPPLPVRHNKYKYSYLKALKKIIINKDNIGENLNESGKPFENSICENINVINWLKSICKDENQVKSILDTSLWIDKDFTKLEKLVQEYINLELRNENSEKGDIFVNSNGQHTGNSYS